MRKFRYILAIGVVVMLAVACSESDHSDDVLQRVELEGVSATAGSILDVGIESRTANVTATDPSATPIVNRGGFGWKLNVKLYKSAVPYLYGANTFVWNATNVWLPQAGQITYFPNYSNQTAEYWLYPSTPTTPVATNQSVDLTMLNQDMLYVKTTTTPAHIVTVALKHAQSMIDFTFDKAPQNLATVRVEQGTPTVTYTPYNVPGTFQYLLILPSTTTVANPVIVVTTTVGTVYRQTVKIIGNPSIGSPTALAVNSRYIFKLIGLELGMSPISVVDWISGGQVAGDYVGVTAYPTFRGLANMSCTIYFDNGLSQILTFNSKGEYTIKPDGRTIIRVEVNGVLCETYVVLDQMIIDLNQYIDQCINNIT